jgi:NADPH-ferrihemoprotein reductase
MPTSTEAIIGVTTILVLVGTVLYFKMGGKPAKVADSKKTEVGSGDVGRQRSYSNMEEKYPAGKMCIYFGSQTGTAEGFARIVLSEGQKHGFDAKVHDLEDFEPEQLQSSRLAVFLVATYGEGDPTDNAAKFYEWLNSDGLESDFLANVDFSVFGLGNTQYENYNKIGRGVNAGMEKLGATRVVEYGEGDDDSTLEDDFEKWKKRAIPALVKKYHPDGAGTVDADVTTKVNLTFKCTDCDPSTAIIPPANIINNSTKHFFSSPDATVTTIREMRDEADGGNTVHMEFDIAGTGVSYQTADNLAVIPNNTNVAVEMFSRTCGGFRLSQYVNLEAISENDDVEEVEDSNAVFKHPFPTPCSIQDIFTKYLDIASIPRKSVLEMFLPYLTDEAQKKWLENLVASRELFQTTVEAEGLTFCSLLANELSSCRIPLADLLHIIPLIQPRYYTICSSSSCFPESIHLTVSVSERKAPSGSTVYGLCSRFLHIMQPNVSQCRIFTRDSLFRLPASLSTPIIMIGPGSGIAPMRALLQERRFQADQEGVKYSQMKNILYFGCKSRKLDFLYKEELTAAVDDGSLTSLQLAFSREQKKKVYVQNLMQEKENAKELCRLVLEEEAHIFVCGGTSMGSSVHDAFVNILSTHGGN